MIAATSNRDRPLTCALYARDRLFRELLASVLAVHARIQVTTHLGSGADWNKAGPARRPDDLLILSVSPPRAAALAVAREFVTVNPGCRVVLLTEPLREFAVPGWLRPHVAGSVDRDESLQALIRLLDAATGSSGVARPRGSRKQLGGRPLSSREQEILHFIGDGLTTAEIASRIGLSSHTIQTHRKRIAAKIGTQGRDLMRWAIIAADAQGRRSS